MSDPALAKSSWPSARHIFDLFPDSRRFRKWKHVDSNYCKAICRRMDRHRPQSIRAASSTLTCVKHKSSFDSKPSHIVGINHRLILGRHSAKLPRSVMNISPILCARVAPAAAGSACFGLRQGWGRHDDVRPSQSSKDKTSSPAEARSRTAVSVRACLINQGRLH